MMISPPIPFRMATLPTLIKRIWALVLLSCLLLCTGCAAQGDAAGTRLTALNIGKADCLLLQTQGKAYLIDTGWERTSAAMLELLRRNGITHLDGVFLTHCDRDHYGGLNALTQSDITVGAWYAAAVYYDIPEDGHPMPAAAAQRGQDVVWLHAGEEIAIDDQAFFRVLGPLTCNTQNENNNSLVLYVQTPDGTLLLTGDMKLDEEYALLESGAVPACDVLKVAFHGDDRASSASFLQAVQPQAAIICTATREEADTPAASVLKALRRLGAQCAVTQDYTRGVTVTLQNGIATFSDVVWDTPDHSQSVRMKLNVSEHVLTLQNSSSDNISLAGWVLYISRSKSCFILPEDAVLPANGVYKIGARPTEVSVSLLLDAKRLFHKSRYDQLMLYDATGALVALTDNGMPE